MIQAKRPRRHRRGYGIGAATRATPLIHAAGIARYITRVCEVSSSAKIGLMMGAEPIYTG